MESEEADTDQLGSLLEFVHTCGGIGPRALERHLDRVLSERTGLVFNWGDALFRVDAEATTWGFLSGDRQTASTPSLWRRLASRLDFSLEEINNAPVKWRDGETGHAAANMPDSMLDDHWYVRGLRASCVAHASEKCDLCPPPTDFRRSFGIWVAPHPNWPDQPRGRWA